MSVDLERGEPGRPLADSRNLDLTGLPASIVDELQRLVATLRASFAETARKATDREAIENWTERLQDWVDAHPARSIIIDDDRENLYDGRGE
mgnify:CR=1 FL=1